jgi:hypothetical protein
MTAVREEQPRPVRSSSEAQQANAAPKPFEQVNEAPAQKKKGWWNKLVD